MYKTRLFEYFDFILNQLIDGDDAISVCLCVHDEQRIGVNDLENHSENRKENQETSLCMSISECGQRISQKHGQRVNERSQVTFDVSIRDVANVSLSQCPDYPQRLKNDRSSEHDGEPLQNRFERTATASLLRFASIDDENTIIEIMRLQRIEIRINFRDCWRI